VWERREAERTGDEYMDNLRRLNPELMAKEAEVYERRHDGCTTTTVSSTEKATTSGT
jgi:hypothetical protein